MKLSEEQLNKIYSNHPYLSLFLDAYEREVLYDEWGRLLDDGRPYLTDQEIIDLVDWWKKKHSKQK